jgi:hypothetical protein
MRFLHSSRMVASCTLALRLWAKDRVFSDPVKILVFLQFSVDYELLKLRVRWYSSLPQTPRYANEISRVYVTVYPNFVKPFQRHCRIYSSLPIKSLLTFPLTMPPTPKAGTILPILATALTPQSLVTLANRSANPSRPCRLNRSSPSRWTGVLNSCIAAGARNCAVLALLASVLRIRPNWFFSEGGRCASCGAISGGRLNEAKMVRLSRAAKRAQDSLGIFAALDPPLKTLAK